jgi:hypothetical protein
MGSSEPDIFTILPFKEKACKPLREIMSFHHSSDKVLYLENNFFLTTKHPDTTVFWNTASTFFSMCIKHYEYSPRSCLSAQMGSGRFYLVFHLLAHESST